MSSPNAPIVPGAAKECGSGPPRERASARGRRFACAIGLIFFGGILALAAGFFWFIERVPTDEVALDRDADGIVVLTGGASRIADALELLAAGHGKRLLISGVHGTTKSGEIARLVPRYQKLFDCCVDLDHTATNTAGNAVETRRWVRQRNFHSLIVVTSSYHMPRTMAELARQLPDVALVPFPVVTEKMREEKWWVSVPTARLLVFEYLKYIVAQIRMRLPPSLGLAGLAGMHGDAKS
jgi:uncharacterized SAM-binding protein YcdF (DUF218 family)